MLAAWSLFAFLPPVNPVYVSRGGEWFVGMGFSDVAHARDDIVFYGGMRRRIQRSMTFGLRGGVNLAPVLFLEGDLNLQIQRKNRDIPFDFALMPEVGVAVGRGNVAVFSIRMNAVLGWLLRVTDVEGSAYSFYLYPIPYLGGYFYRVERVDMDPLTGKLVTRSEVVGEMDGGFRISAGGRFTRRMGWDVDILVGRFSWVFGGTLRFF